MLRTIWIIVKCAIAFYVAVTVVAVIVLVIADAVRMSR